LATLTAVYFTGVLTWVLANWFLTNSGFGPESSPLRVFWLQMHSISSLWFLALFGYIFHSHVIPSWRRGRKRLSGAILTSVLIFLSLTVPGLFYISNDALKNSVALIHTYVGLSLVLVFLLHYFSKRI
jgi:hypothetical protein